MLNKTFALQSFYVHFHFIFNSRSNAWLFHIAVSLLSRGGGVSGVVEHVVVDLIEAEVEASEVVEVVVVSEEGVEDNPLVSTLFHLLFFSR